MLLRRFFRLSTFQMINIKLKALMWAISSTSRLLAQLLKQQRGSNISLVQSRRMMGLLPVTGSFKPLILVANLSLFFSIGTRMATARSSRVLPNGCVHLSRQSPLTLWCMPGAVSTTVTQDKTDFVWKAFNTTWTWLPLGKSSLECIQWCG